jgi:ABC-type transporter MlaC component
MSTVRLHARFPLLLALVASAGMLASATPARADDPQGFIQQQHVKLQTMLHEQASPGRDAKVNKALDGFVDYDELVRRSFGEPCHATLPQCDDLWAHYSDDQKKELHDLLKQVVEASYRRNLTKTLDYDVSYTGSRVAGGDTRVLTEAKSKSNPRDTPLRVDYLVRQTPAGPRVVDIVTEGSSFSKNLYVQFRKMDDYGKIVTKLKDKLAKTE